MSDCKQQMIDSLKHIAETIENPPIVLVDDPTLTIEDEGYTYDDDADQWLDPNGDPVDTTEMSAYDYLADALDIEYRVGSNREYRSAEILVAFGGPNIWIDTRTSTIHAAWWGDTASLKYIDGMGLDDACEELFNC